MISRGARSRGRSFRTNSVVDLSAATRALVSRNASRSSHTNTLKALPTRNRWLTLNRADAALLASTMVESGFFAVLQAASLEQAKEIVEASQETRLPFDIDIVPVNQFPHFD